MDVANAISPTAKKEIVGIRPGEKLHEEMITEHDSFNTIDIGDKFVMAANEDQKNKFKKYYADAKDINYGFSYNSKDNEDFLTVDEIRQEIKKHVDKEFNIEEVSAIR